MPTTFRPTRREVLAATGSLATTSFLAAAEPLPANKVYRIGVLSAAINGKPQKTNGHTWHFAQYFHPEISLPAIRKHLDPGSSRMFEKYLRNPRYNFDQLPFPDTRITHVYANPVG